MNSRIESETIVEYNAQGRMAKTAIMTYADGFLAKIVTQEYEYDSSGIKVKQAETMDDTINHARHVATLVSLPQSLLVSYCM